MGLHACCGMHRVLIAVVTTKLVLLHPEQTFIQFSQTIMGKWLGKIVIVIYLVQWYTIIPIVLRQFSDLLRVLLLNSTPGLFIILPMVLIVIYVTYSGGIDGIGRVSEILGPLIFLMILVVLTTNMGNVQWNRLLPFYADSGTFGNGTASRETDKLARDLIKRRPELKLTAIVVSEAGASVYSASEFASRELPGMDVSLRGAVSIARRLQDPLAELVKVDPKSIGVGQYQHDVGQAHLARSLDAMVEDCVNAVGVDVNTASPPLLERVSGLNHAVAQSIVAYRDDKGRFASRAALREVPRLGEKAFEQAAGFLRIMNGDNPLDASAVHPESYPAVEKILADLKQDIKHVIGNGKVLKSARSGEVCR